MGNASKTPSKGRTGNKTTVFKTTDNLKKEDLEKQLLDCRKRLPASCTKKKHKLICCDLPLKAIR
jgi:hypothetical protein